MRWGPWGMAGALLCLGTACVPDGKRSYKPPADAGSATPAAGVQIDPRVKPFFDDFVAECQARSHALCLERLAAFKEIRVGAYPIEFFGEGFPGRALGAVSDEAPYLGATSIVVQLDPFLGTNAACYGKILMFHMLGHALLGWKHPTPQNGDDDVKYSNTSIMGYDLYPICQKISDNMTTLVADLFAGTLRDDVAEDAYSRGEGESTTDYDTRMSGLISRTAVRGALSH